MAKYECEKPGRANNSINARRILGVKLDAISAEIKRQKRHNNINDKKTGPRYLAWNEFKKTGKFIDACNAVDKVYKKGTFSKSDICAWIYEELEKAKETKNIDEAR